MTKERELLRNIVPQLKKGNQHRSRLEKTVAASPCLKEEEGRSSIIKKLNYCKHTVPKARRQCYNKSPRKEERRGPESGLRKA